VCSGSLKPCGNLQTDLSIRARGLRESACISMLSAATTLLMRRRNPDIPDVEESVVSTMNVGRCDDPRRDDLRNLFFAIDPAYPNAWNQTLRLWKFAVQVSLFRGPAASFRMVQNAHLTCEFLPRMVRPMNNHRRSTKLSDIASIRQGHPFRGAITAFPDGPVRVIQLKNLSASGVHNPCDLLRTRLHPRKAPDWVQEGDVLLAARGAHPLAVLLCNPPADTVCSPHLYVIRVSDHERIMPAFLAWQLNQEGAQEYLRRQSAGSRQQSLRKAAIEELRVQLPPLLLQQRIVSIARAAQLEKLHCEQMIAARHQEVARYAAHILDERPR